MAKGKPWTVEDERQLRELLTEKKSMRSIAKIMCKTLMAVRLKASRLGLEEDNGSENNTPLSSTLEKLVLPDELPSIEEELKTLVGALQQLETGKLDKLGVLRLRTIIMGVKVYQELIAEYVDYRGLESELLEWRENYADLAKKSTNPPAQ
jgi:hypothetical protein